MNSIVLTSQKSSSRKNYMPSRIPCGEQWRLGLLLRKNVTKQDKRFAAFEWRRHKLRRQECKPRSLARDKLLRQPWTARTVFEKISMQHRNGFNGLKESAPSSTTRLKISTS